jgi:hypothetical protein
MEIVTTSAHLEHTELETLAEHAQTTVLYAQMDKIA